VWKRSSFNLAIQFKICYWFICHFRKSWFLKAFWTSSEYLNRTHSAVLTRSKLHKFVFNKSQVKYHKFIWQLISFNWRIIGKIVWVFWFWLITNVQTVKPTEWWHFDSCSSILSDRRLKVSSRKSVLWITRRLRRLRWCPIRFDLAWSISIRKFFRIQV
jgi:hypothetical protein